MRTKRKPASGPAPWGIHESGGFMPDPNDPAIGSKPREWPDPKIAKWIDHALTDAYVEAAVSFADGAATWLRDTKQPGLRCRIGKHRASWVYFRDDRRHGTRKTSSKVLGRFPDMGVDKARDLAAIEAGKHVSGTAGPGKRSALKFEAAWNAYLERLEKKVANANRDRAEKGIAPKPARWAYNARHLGGQWLLPEWGTWSLADMVANPGAVKSFHERVAEKSGPVSADHCARLIRACYRRAAKDDTSLPMDREPTSSVEYHKRREAKRSMKRRDFPLWLAAWRALPDAPPPSYRKGMWAATRKEYFAFCLFSGARPGEVARIRWRDVKLAERVVEIPAAKADNTIRIVMSAPIARLLKRARDKGKPTNGDSLVFPYCSQLRDELPTRGHAFRHTYRTLCASLEINPTLVRVMQGWADDEVSEDYVTE